MATAAKDFGFGHKLCLNDFLIEKELARTAAGTVYRAKHGRTGRTVVLKARRNAEIGRDGDIEHEVNRIDFRIYAIENALRLVICQLC